MKNKHKKLKGGIQTMRKTRKTGIALIAMLVASIFAVPLIPFAFANHNTERQPEDLNGDGWVDRDDLEILLKNWGPCKYILSTYAKKNCIGDINQDQVVGVEDLLALLAAWNPRPNPDIDGDGIVGPNDLAILLDEWGKCNSTLTSTKANDYCRADLNGDHVVGVEDLLILLGAWTHGNDKRSLPRTLDHPLSTVEVEKMEDPSVRKCGTNYKRSLTAAKSITLCEKKPVLTAIQA